MHEVIVEFDLADETPVFAATVEWFEALQDTVNDKGVVLVAHSDEISMAFSITCHLGRAVRLGHIDTDRTACHTFHHFVQLEILQ